jgi:hypothetical protein
MRTYYGYHVDYQRLANKALLHFKQGLFALRLRLLCDANKPCLKSEGKFMASALPN